MPAATSPAPRGACCPVCWGHRNRVLKVWHEGRYTHRNRRCRTCKDTVYRTTDQGAGLVRQRAKEK